MPRRRAQLPVLRSLPSSSGEPDVLLARGAQVEDPKPAMLPPPALGELLLGQIDQLLDWVADLRELAIRRGAGGIDETLAEAASSTAPAAAADLVALETPGRGAYRVVVTTFQSGVVDANTNNLELLVGQRRISTLITTGSPVAAVFDRVELSDLDTLSVRAIVAGGAGAIYHATLAATRIE